MFKTSTTIALVLLILTALLFGSCTVRIEKRNDGPDIEKSFAVSEFNALDVSDNVEVIYTVSDSTSVLVKGKENSVKNLILNCDKNGTLHIYNKSEEDKSEDNKQKSSPLYWVFNENNYKGVTVYISGPNINNISISGAGNFTCKNALHPENLSIFVNGAGDIDLDSIQTKDFRLNISGAGDFDAKAITAEKVDFKATGAGDIDSHIINASSVSIAISGAGDVDADLTDCGNVYVSVTGAGDAKLKGNVQTFKYDVSGAGDIDTKNLKIGK